MRSVTTQRFRKAFSRLPASIQGRARDVYRLWRQNPQHPSLHFKKVHVSLPIYSVRIGLGCRALGVFEGDTFIWFWIGFHDEYEKMIKKL